MGCGGSKEAKNAGDAPVAKDAPAADAKADAPAAADGAAPAPAAEEPAKHVVHSTSADGSIHVGDAITITSGKEKFIGTQCIVDGVTDDGRVLVQTTDGKKLSLRSATVTKIEDEAVIAEVKARFADAQAAAPGGDAAPAAAEEA